MSELILEKKQAFANLSTIQRKIDDCIKQLKLNVSDADKVITLNRNLAQLHMEWHIEYKKYIALEKQFTELIQIHMSELMVKYF